MRRAQPEFSLQCAVADYLRLVLPESVFWTTFPAGGGGKIRGSRLKRMGLKVGVADMLICWPQCDNGLPILWAELKALKGRQTHEQIIFSEHVAWLGHHYAVWHSLHDCDRTLRALKVPMTGWQLPSAPLAKRRMG